MTEVFGIPTKLVIRVIGGLFVVVYGWQLAARGLTRETVVEELITAGVFVVFLLIGWSAVVSLGPTTSTMTLCDCPCGCEPCDYLTQDRTWHDECSCRELKCPCVERCGC